MKRISFLCMKGLETFIDPIVNSLDKNDDYVVNKQYLDLNLSDAKQKIHDAIHWSDIVWFEWANEMAIVGLNDEVFPEIKKKKVIVRLHSYEALSDMPTQIKWENVTTIIYVAPHIAHIINTYFPEQNINSNVEYTIIPNGVDLNKCKLSVYEEPYLDIAWVGYINYKKNPPMMLQIMYELSIRDDLYNLHIAGSFQDRRYEIYLKHMIKEMHLGSNVFFDGWVENMNKWYKDKSILLSTSIHEGHSLCITEAMARGITPVIHNFYGAEKQYPEGLLFDTVKDAVDLVVESLGAETRWLRNYVIDKGWTLQNQIKEIKEVINGL